MKVLLLSPYPDGIAKVLKNNNDQFLIYNNEIDINFLRKNSINFIISYGYKFIIKENIIKQFNNSIINLHISFLPFNRGYYPNLWSHLEGSPCGVSIHKINEGIDKGEILVQKQIKFDTDCHTFKSSYLILRKEIEELFLMNWHLLKKGGIKSKKSSQVGSYRNKKEGDNVMMFFKDGWDTPIPLGIEIYKNNFFKNQILNLIMDKIYFKIVNKNSKVDINLLYKLLSLRVFNISHNSLPDFDKHKEFVLNNPYRIWNFIELNNKVIGTFYITFENVISINLSNPNKKIYIYLIEKILKEFLPLKEIKSLRSKYFIFNTNPNNAEYINALESLKLVHIQSTYSYQQNN